MIKHIGKWQARVKHMGKERHFGYFDSLDDAIKARDEGAARVFGRFYSGNAPQNQSVAV